MIIEQYQRYLSGRDKFKGKDIAQKNPAKRNADETRARILAAATRCFAENGYSATGTRDVAVAAGVSLPLISRYFGSKASLFEKVISEALDYRPFLGLSRAEFGVTLTGLITGAHAGEVPTSIAVLAAGDPEARIVATRVVDNQVIKPLAEWLGPPQGTRRAVAIAMLGAGLVTHLHLLPLQVQGTIKPGDPLLRWFAAAFQRLVDVAEDCEDWAE